MKNIAADLVGKRFGSLVVLERAGSTAQGKAQWRCRCDCGAEIIAITAPLQAGSKTCCPDCSRKKKLPYRKDLTGLRVGRLTVLGYSEEETERQAKRHQERKTYWKCQCDCGNITYQITAQLTGARKVESCGCLAKEKAAKIMKEKVQPLGAATRFIDLTGQKFGKLTVMKRAEQNDTSGRPAWECLCDCGNRCIVSGTSLKSGGTQSCGCIGNSLGEAKIKEILDIAKVPYKQEYTFDDLVDEGPLRYDFAIFDIYGNLRELIEYDGRQHSDQTSQWFNEKVVKHDEMKTQYAREHNIPLLRIPYTDKDNINILYLLEHIKPLSL